MWSPRYSINIILLILISSYFCKTLATSNANVNVEIPIIFGVYNPFNTTPLDTTGKIVITSQNSLANYMITISTGSSGNYAMRTMRSSHYILYYNIYIDPTRNNVLGNGANNSTYITGNGNCVNNCRFEHIIYARIPPLQKNVNAGFYQDSLLVTLTY